MEILTTLDAQCSCYVSRIVTVNQIHILAFTCPYAHTHTHTRFTAGIEYIKAPTWLFHSLQDDAVPSSISLELMQK